MAIAPLRLRWVPLLLLALAPLSACGFIVHGTTQLVLIDSVPPGQEVSVDGEPHTTPAWLRLKRKHNHVVTARNAEGATARRVLLSESNGMYQLWDIFWLPIVFNLIDGLTGGDSALVPQQLMVPVPPLGSAVDRWW